MPLDLLRVLPGPQQHKWDIPWCDLNHLSVVVGATCGTLTLSFVIDWLNQGSSFLALKVQEVSSELGMSIFDLCISEGQINIMLYSLKM